MSGSDERVVGFDIREMWSEAGVNWDAGRREAFLFRRDVDKPLSTDTMIWPSIFDAAAMPRPTGYTGHQDLWDSLEELRAWVAGQRLAARRCFIIAVTLPLSACDAAERERWDHELTGTTPAVPEANWPLLGYDVSDKWLLSGLSNCGFLPATDNVEELRARWAPHLNRSHLFDSLAKAADFRAFSDSRVGEHAPFFVFGLRLVSEAVAGAPSV